MQVGKSSRSRLEMQAMSGRDDGRISPREFSLDDLEGFDSPESTTEDITDVSDILRKASNIDPGAVLFLIGKFCHQICFE